MMVTVNTLMKKDPVIVDLSTSVIEAAQLMRACNVESILVACRGHILGIVTETDIVRNFIGANKVSYFLSVRDIMSRPALGIDEQRPLAEAADLMHKHRTLHLGVTKAGSLIGVISACDFLRPMTFSHW
jgi:CBS domain-containing protein